jgi:hypothetical protein
MSKLKDGEDQQNPASGVSLPEIKVPEDVL